MQAYNHIELEMTQLSRRRIGWLARMVRHACASFENPKSGSGDAQNEIASQYGMRSQINSTEQPTCNTNFSALIVDDKDESWFVFKSLIPDCVNAHRSISGTSAIDALVTQRPDFILIDFEMPALDGLDALNVLGEIRRLQAAADEARSIIYAHTYTNNSEITALIREVGFDGILSKPLCQDELNDVLKMVASGIYSSNTDTDFWIDQSFLEQFPSFIESRLSLIDQMEHAVQKKDILALKRAAHTLAGSPALHGFNGGIALCRGINQINRIEEAVDIKEQLAALRSFFISPTIR